MLVYGCFKVSLLYLISHYQRPLLLEMRYMRSQREADMNRGNRFADLMEQARKKKEREQEQKWQTHIEEREYRREERETHTLRINIGLAIFAGLAAIAALWQGFESHRATKEAQRNFETTREDAKESAAQARQDALDTINKQIEASRELRDQQHAAPTQPNQRPQSPHSPSTFRNAPTSP